MKKSAIILLILFSSSLMAQVYIDGGKTRHRFAQMTLGIDTKVNLGKGAYSYLRDSDNQLNRIDVESQFSSRFIIGGTHFWGHADFYIAIPLRNWNKSGFSEGVETGFRYFPWQIKHNKLRPFIGTAFLRHSYQQGEGADVSRYKYPLTGGVMYNRGNHLFEIGAGYNFDSMRNYYISTTERVNIRTNPFWLSIGYKWMIESTLSAEKDWKSGRTQAITDTLAKRKKLNGITLSIGPSSAFFLKNSDHNDATAPYADNHKTSVFPEMGIGYYWHTPDLQVQATYRRNKSEIAAYDFNQLATRTALTLETYKFIGDYHGFAPFIGAAISYEQLLVNQVQDGVNTDGSFEGFKPGITVGWDIRPNRIQSFYLRTHLRYFPNMKVDMGANKSVSFDQFEFNFIQLVIFPEALIKKKLIRQ